MFEGKYVAVAMSVSSQVNWACNFIIGLVFPFFVQYLGPYSFAPFACVLAGCFVFALTVLPETQGTTPEELAAEMTRTLSQNVIYQPNLIVGDATGTVSVAGNTNTTTTTSTTPNDIDMEWSKAMAELQHDEEKARKQGTYDYGFQPIENPEKG